MGTLTWPRTLFVAYRKNHLTGDEKGEAQVFLDRLFRAFGHDGAIEAGAKLEHRVAKRAAGGTAFADLVWRPRVLIEMKKGRQPLARHYQQALEYWIDLVPDRPQYVVLCNFDEFWIYDLNRQLDEPLDRVSIEDLPKRWEVLGFLLPSPAKPIFGNDLVKVTRDAASTVVRVTNSLIGRGTSRADAQRFTMQCVMAMFAEDTGLLPTHTYTQAVEDSASGGSAYDLLFGLFREMNTPGETPAGRFKGTPYFNGGLYRVITPFDLQLDEMIALHHAASFDWGDVRPEIFGTLFEQSLGEDERHAYGAHFTSGADIQRIVLPTIVRPWRDRIEAATTLVELGRLEAELLAFRVLDPACGCGNFLYVAYRELRRLEKRLIERRVELSKRERKRSRGGLGQLAFVRTDQFFGIDINPFATEIAKVTLMLARQLAALELGDEQQVLPLDDLDNNFRTGDALFLDWPAFDACIGNPPYLGRRRLIEERGADYAAQLSAAYPDVGGVSDYVVYWFRLAHDRLPMGGRAGLAPIVHEISGVRRDRFPGS
jgi:type II restriction/modification system DNA methylase subunit YeeA